MSSTATGRELTLWKWGLIFIVCWTMAYVFFVKEEWLVRQVEEERAQTRVVLGERAAARAEGNARSVWEATFVHSHVIEATFKIMEPGKEVDDTDAKVNGFLSPLRDWAAGRMRVCWTLLYQLFVRVAVASTWWTYALVVAVPFIVDAFVSRKIKAAGFGLTSPHMYVLGRHAMFSMPLGAFLLLLSPIQLPATLTPILIVLMSIALWTSISMFAKRA